MDEPINPIALTPRQWQVVQHLVVGATDKQIAEQLGLSSRTVSNTLRHVYDRTGVSNRARVAELFIKGMLVKDESRR